MKKEVKKFLEFNGKTIFFVSVDGQYWIAIKPICEALNVHYEHQRKLLQKDKILSQLPCQHGVVAADGKVRKMVCLPEFFIYGWIFSIQSQSEKLQQYKLECYRVLFEHFHGVIAGRKDLLKMKAKAEIELAEVMASLGSEQALKYKKTKKRLNSIVQKLRKLDSSVVQKEKNLFNQG